MPPVVTTTPVPQRTPVPGGSTGGYPRPATRRPGLPVQGRPPRPPAERRQDAGLADDAGLYGRSVVDDHGKRTRVAEERARRDELAAFLRARREGLQPEDLGIPRRGRRRVKGLRRHEVADTAGVSVTWYTWLEQGRDIHTTSQVIEALARALRLDDDGHRYLRRLAGVAARTLDHGHPVASESLVALVDNLLPHPAHLMEPATDLVTWNRAYSRLFVDPAGLERSRRNGLWIQVMHPSLRERLDNWESETEHAIARFRAEASKYPGDARFGEVIGELRDGSDFFRSTWQRHVVQSFAGHVETIRHPDVGPIRARLVQLRPLDDHRLLVMAHMLEDDESRERMALLLSD